jgi:hypothetical protein
MPVKVLGYFCAQHTGVHRMIVEALLTAILLLRKRTHTCRQETLSLPPDLFSPPIQLVLSSRDDSLCSCTTRTSE